VPQFDNYPAEHGGWLDQARDNQPVADDRFERKDFTALI